MVLNGPQAKIEGLRKEMLEAAHSAIAWADVVIRMENHSKRSLAMPSGKTDTD